MAKKYLKTVQLCETLQTSRWSIYRAVKAGRLKGVRLSPTGPLRFDQAAVEAALGRQGRRKAR